jgi:hypothetical protein
MTSRMMGASLVALLAMAPTCAEAEPHSSPVQILSVRPYYAGSGSAEYAYIKTTPSSVCTDATYFTLALNSPAGEAMFSTALTALSSGRSVTIEVSNSTGCTMIANGGPQVQSLTLLASGYSGPF